MFPKGALTPARWSGLSVGRAFLSHELRKNIVFSQLLILTLIGLVIHLIGDSLRGDFAIAGFAFLMAIATGAAYWLNERKKHALAKFIFFASANIIFFIVASIVPRECAVSALFLGLIGVALVVHPQNELSKGIFYASISFLLLVTLELTNYQAFGPIRVIEKSSLFNSILNISSACIILMICILFAVQQNYRAELLLLKRGNQLTKTNAKLDKILYSASHDLRAPLNSIKGLVALASMESEKKNLNQYFKLIEDRIGALDKFILDILEFSRSTKKQLLIETISISKMVNEVAESLKYMDGASRVKLIQEFGTADLLSTDRKSLSVILNNLISNSIKYHNYNQEISWIKIKMHQESDAVRLEVEDNGIGIAEEHQSKVFEMFHRATESSSGSGLGLFIVKETIENLNGNISLQSKYGKGSKFIITLPKPIEELEIV